MVQRGRWDYRDGRRGVHEKKERYVQGVSKGVVAGGKVPGVANTS